MHLHTSTYPYLIYFSKVIFWILPNIVFIIHQCKHIVQREALIPYLLGVERARGVVYKPFDHTQAPGTSCDCHSPLHIVMTGDNISDKSAWY